VPQSPGKIVVTGGAGFIGSHLVDRLLDNGSSQVVVLDNLHRGRLENLAERQSDPLLDFIHGDIRNPRTVAEAFREASTVYHLAAQSRVMGAVEDQDYSFETNVIGTYNVLRAATDADVNALVFASSREVYGDPIDLPVEEGQPLLAINSYGASKVMGEAYCRAFRRTFGLHSVILRLANVYGPRDVGRVVPLWMDLASSGRDLNIYGGKQLLDFVWIDLVVEALVRAADVPGPLPPINIASGTGTRIVDLARRIIRLSSSRSRVNTQQARAVEVTRFVANVSRMRQMLGVEPPADPLVYLDRMIANVSRPLAEQTVDSGLAGPPQFYPAFDERTRPQPGHHWAASVGQPLIAARVPE
jgi:nucleoside-diphosphate-sugar epimerase